MLGTTLDSGRQLKAEWHRKPEPLSTQNSRCAGEIRGIRGSRACATGSPQPLPTPPGQQGGWGGAASGDAVGCGPGGQGCQGRVPREHLESTQTGPHCWLCWDQMFEIYIHCLRSELSLTCWAMELPFYTSHPFPFHGPGVQRRRFGEALL